MNIRNASAAVLAFLLAACGSYPRDIEGTSERVEREGAMRVAFAELSPLQEAIAQRYVQRVAARTGARVRQEHEGATETLFARLEQGELDLVIAGTALDSPWLDRVAVVEPLAMRRQGENVIVLTPVARAGENQWIGLLEQESRDMGSSR